jgi:hypothetical protein
LLGLLDQQLFPGLSADELRAWCSPAVTEDTRLIARTLGSYYSERTVFADSSRALADDEAGTLQAHAIIRALSDEQRRSLLVCEPLYKAPQFASA